MRGESDLHECGGSTPPASRTEAEPNEGAPTDSAAGGKSSGSSVPLSFTSDERQFLLRLARETIERLVRSAPWPQVDPATIPDKLRQRRACFVTLTKSGRLRGCIGHVHPTVPLCQAVIENADGAARRDYRFPPVEPDEVLQLRIEISVLTNPSPLKFTSTDELLRQLAPQRDGVFLELHECRATYLPQVWRQLPDKVAFLNSLALKAGCGASAWREPGTLISVYQVEAFEEPEG